MITVGISIAVIAILGLWFALAVARRVRKWVDENGGEKKAEQRVGWMGHAHGLWWIVGAGIGGLKYIYKAWKTAPSGSSAQLGWGALLAFIVALGLFAIVKLVDRRLNPPHEMEREAVVSEKGFPETTVR